MSGSQRKWRPADVAWILLCHKIHKLFRRREHKLHCVCEGNRQGL